jgi:hypothetical protein
VVTDDPELQLAVSSIKTYAFEIVAYVAGNGSGAMGIAFGMHYSGTYNGSSSNFAATYGTAGQAYLTGNSVAASAFGSLTAATVSSSSGSGYTAIIIKGTLSVTGTGTLAFSWGQNSASATALQVYPGSYMTLTPI